MSIIFLLIPLSILFAVAFLFAFIWSVRSGQYEDTTTPSMRVLLDDQREPRPERCERATFPLTLTLSPREREQQAGASLPSHARPAVTAETSAVQLQPKQNRSAAVSQTSRSGSNHAATGFQHSRAPVLKGRTEISDDSSNQS
jgi:cbb3-type cytochrome oxidase maturation protein